MADNARRLVYEDDALLDAFGQHVLRLSQEQALLIADARVAAVVIFDHPRVIPLIVLDDDLAKRQPQTLQR